MVCLGLEPGGSGWQANTNQLSYGGTQKNYFFDVKPARSRSRLCNTVLYFFKMDSV